MTHSPLTNEIRLSPQSSSRQGATVDTYQIHHLAGTDGERAVNDMISGADGGSANYVITNEGKIILVVDEDDRAWASGSPDDGGRGAAEDRRSINVEIENETAGPEWRISAAALAAAAALLNDLRSRYNITRVVGHRDLYTAANGWASYPTYCPGPNTVATITVIADNTTPPAQIGHPGMYLFRTLDGSVHLVTSGGMVPITSSQHLTLIERMFASYPKWDTFNVVERDIVHAYIKAANTADDVETARILDALGKVKVDPAPIVAAVTAAIANAGVQVDASAIAEAVADAFAQRLDA